LIPFGTKVIMSRNAVATDVVILGTFWGHFGDKKGVSEIVPKLLTDAR